MSSISKITASLVTANNDNTLALANVNFDFSLCKVEAPKEFHSLGESLTSQRRETAEDGVLHQTARRLGSLFQDAISRTPRLVEAYGQRVSEISQKLNANLKGKAAKTYGPFDGHIGLDASSIWAGATSGPSAIAVHLLACMLAQTWPGPEAVSIWSELVAERKKEIGNGCRAGDMFSIATLMAARQDLRRSDLADWDASARSWLRSAGSVKLKEHKQLMLIINNVDIAVNNTAAMYSNVLTAWKTAMVGLENLLNGASQRVQNGAVLLGFAAWHIFPDIVVLGQKLTEVNFKDSLVPAGALLEIGLQNTSREDTRGIFWSLSLAHLRYYGRAVAVSRSPTYDENRVSFDQLYIMALGSVVSRWKLYVAQSNFNPLLDFLRSLGQIMDIEKGLYENSWLCGLIRAASSIQQTSGIDAKYASLLFSYGRNQGKAIIPTIPKLFGLSRYPALIGLSRDEEAKIAVLRDAAETWQLDGDLCIIRYRHRCSDGRNYFEYASAVKPQRSSKRSAPGMEVPSRHHRRWLDLNATCSEQSVERCINCTINAGHQAEPDILKRRDELKEISESCIPMIMHVRCLEATKHGETFKAFYTALRTTSADSTLSILSYGDSSNKDSPPGLHNKSKDWTETLYEQNFILVLGSMHDAGLFVAERVFESQKIEQLASLRPSLKACTTFVRNISAQDLETYFLKAADWMQEGSIRALRALATGTVIYRSFPDATIPLRICSRALNKASWIPRVTQPEEAGFMLYPIDRATKFSCLAFFESGSCDIRPSLLTRVIAMSTGDSLYITECLLSDPAVDHDHHGIRRAIGNIGRPGISMLLSPGNVQIRPPKTDSWMLVDPTRFDGARMDNFPATSMHLSFTGYELPVGNNPTGGRDVEAAIVETAVSILDSGEWVADVDLMGGESEHFSCTIGQPTHPKAEFYRFIKLPERARFGDQMDCEHGNTIPKKFSFNSIDTWDELLADLEGPGLVRCHGNRIARVATTAVNLQKGRIVHALPDGCCLQCLEDYFDSEGLHELSDSVVIIM